MELTLTITGRNYEQILKKAEEQAAKFFERHSRQWKIEVGEIVVTKTTARQSGFEISYEYEYEAEVTVKPYTPEPVPFSQHPYGRDVEFVSGIGRVKQ